VTIQGPSGDFAATRKEAADVALVQSAQGLSPPGAISTTPPRSATISVWGDS
jgi:hypothetical protein